MAKPGDRIYFGKFVNAAVDTVWIGGVVSENRYKAIRRIKTITELMDIELVEISIDDSFELFENISEEEQNHYKDTDFFLYKPVKLKRE